MFKMTLGSIAFRKRCNGSFDLAKFLNHPSGGHVIIEGGDISPEAKRAVYGAISLKIHDDAKRGRYEYRLRAVYDEAQEFIGESEAKGLRELRKFGVSMTVISQSIGFPADVREAILQNCGRVEVFRCHSPDTARLFAGMLAPLMGGGSDSLSKRTADLQERIMGQDDRWRFVREGNRAWHELVPFVTGPYPWPGLAEKRTWQAVRKAIGEHGVKFSEESSSETPAESNKPEEQSRRSARKTNSPAMRLRREIYGS
jgi:hypothetical protein